MLVVNDLTKDLDDQDDAIAELARIWRSGERARLAQLKLCRRVQEQDQRIRLRSGKVSIRTSLTDITALRFCLRSEPGVQ